MLNRRTLIGSVIALTVTGAIASSATAEELSALFMSQAAYSEADVKAMTAEFESANPGTTVKLEFVPYDALYDKIVASKAAGGAGYDVVLYDVIWPANFAENGVLVDVTDKVAAMDKAAVFDGAWATTEYSGQYYGMPWILDTKYLFANKDMLDKAGVTAMPKTWAEVMAAAQKVKDAGLVEYPLVFDWAQAEAVICDYTALVGAYQGAFLKDGAPAFNSGGGVEALQFMVDAMKSGLVNPNSTSYLEEDVRKVFSAGDAAMAVNWTYMYNLAQNNPDESKINGMVEIAPLPGVEGRAAASAVNGSMGLGITAGSAKPDLAWSYISFMTSQAVQNSYAKNSLPIWKSSYSDPVVTTGQEAVVAAADTSIAIMTPRPMFPAYPELSSLLQKAIHKALAGEMSAQDALNEAADAAAKIR
ncbi:MAG: extracellular solute-binding protein [Rhodobacteraceae bacterium]|nr:extracellular solute-binding protein [Paracoccaceae bacterium]